MKKIVVVFLILLSIYANAQEETKKDSIKIDEVLDEAIVKAVRVNSESPVTHSNLTKKEISKRNLGQDIPILMNYMPNVVTSSDAGAGVGYTYIRVRGSDASRVNVTVNGIPYNDAESQGTFWVNMGDFASSTQSLQLQRGVGTSTNGSGAFGASLNLLTDAVSENANGEISNSFGSYGTRKHTLKFSTGKLNIDTKKNQSVELSGRLSNIYSDGYVDRAFTDLKSYFLQGAYVDENTLIKALAFGGNEQTYQAWYGLDATQLEEDRRQNPYTYDNETDNYQQDHYQLHWNEKLNEKWSTNLGLNFTHGEGYFEQYKSGKKPEGYADLVVATDDDRTDLIVRRWLDNDFFVANFNAIYSIEKLNVISGISYSNYTGDHFGEVIWAKEFAENASIRDRFYESDATKNDFSIFSKATFNLSEKLKTYIDLQGRFVSYSTSGLTSDRNNIDVNTDFSFFNPKVGFTYRINDNNSLYTSYSRANREPNRKDFELNSNVKSEKLNDFELGWRFRKDDFKLNTNIYYMHYKDQLILTGDIDDTGDYTRENVDESYRLGLEIDADIQLSDKFTLRPNLSLSANKIKSFSINRDNTTTYLGDSEIAFSPSIVAGNALAYSPSENFQIALLSKFVGEQYLSNTETEASRLDSYFTSDFNISYELKTNSIFKSIVFTGLVNNIFNKEYVDRGYTYLDFWTGPTSFEVQGYYPQATRNFLMGMTLNF